MTHANTITELSAFRLELLKRAGTARDSYVDSTAYAEQYAGEALVALEQARDYSAILRTLDPDNADQYPDPELPVDARLEPPLATGLRQLADLIAKHPELTEGCHPVINQFPRGATGEERLRNIETLADLIGVKPQWRGTHYLAQLTLPGGLEFCPVQIEGVYESAHMARTRPPWLPEPEPAAEPEAANPLAGLVISDSTIHEAEEISKWHARQRELAESLYVGQKVSHEGHDFYEVTWVGVAGDGVARCEITPVRGHLGPSLPRQTVEVTEVKPLSVDDGDADETGGAR